MAAEGPSPFEDPNREWRLVEMQGAPFEGTATLVFPEQDRVAGQAPCNRFMGKAEWSPEATTFGPLAATMMACPDLDQERVVLEALETVTALVIEADSLILTLGDGSRMVYTSAPAE